MFTSSFESNKSTVDNGLNAIRSLSAGMPVVVGGGEFIMIDKIYLRQPIASENNVEPIECDLISPQLNQTDFIMFVNTNISPDESTLLSNQLEQSNLADTISIPLIISSLQKDFVTALQSEIIVEEIIWSRSHKEELLDKPLQARINPQSGPLYRALNASKLGAKITRIDSAWDLHIPDIEYPENEQPFVWGTGISLDGKVEQPYCRIIQQATHENNLELSI